MKYFNDRRTRYSGREVNAAGFMPWIFILIISAMLVFPASLLSAGEELATGRQLAQQATKKNKVWITAEHSKFEILKQEFKSGPEVTRACLSCHSEASTQVQKTIHWTWMDDSEIGKLAQLGKGGLSINNF